MKSLRRRLLAAALCTPLGALGTARAQSAALPARPLRIVVPVPPGGSLDLLARTVARELSPRIGQPVVVENHGGAGGNIAFGLVASAPPDAHTILLGWDSLSINPALYGTVPFRLDQFAPVTLAITSPQVLVINEQKLPAKTLADFVRIARERGGKIAVASAGSGSPGHLAGTLLKNLASIDFTHVPYKGGGPALADLIAGHVDAAFVTLPAATPHLAANRLAALGVTSTRRSSGLPQLPTFVEAGVAGYEIDSWQGFFVPAGSPQAAIDRLHAEIATVLRDDRIRAQLVAQGFEVVAGPPQALARELERTTPKWVQLVQASGARVD
ncbi:MAG: tripartite tricarboxylate transporter substrate binding protein [Burkholderiales bacterium]|nr:tripartite tricarboxylate transporter substrate binding protein [Burkholderiales bacterium]